MGKKLIDYSAGVPSARAVKEAGFVGAIRYVSPARDAWMKGKPIRKAEADDYKAHGLEIVSIYQRLKEDWRRGRTGGVVDATDAISHHLEAGGPKGAVIYCAIDSNPSLHEYNTIARQYIEGFWDTLVSLGYRKGVYCNTKVFAWLEEDGHSGFLWWKHGWGSDGTIAGAALHQYEIDKYTVDGVKVDRNHAYVDDYGQWSKATQTEPTPEPPKEETTVKKIEVPGGITPDWRGDPTWMADVLRAEGLTVVEAPGWRNRGHGDFRDIRGVMLHHTGPGSTAGLRNIVTNGVTYADGSRLAGPLCNLYLRKDGVWEVIAAGIAWHAGKGSYPGIPTDMGNYHLIGIEAENSGTEGWSRTQWDSYARGVAALLRKVALREDRGIAHKEWAGRSQGKWDPGMMDMAEMRADIRGYINQTSYLPPDPDRFPLPHGWYYGPLEGPNESVSMRFGTELPEWGEGLKRWQRAVGIPGTGVWDDETARVATQLQKERGWPNNPNWTKVNGGFGGVYEGEWNAVIREGWRPGEAVPDYRPDPTGPEDELGSEAPVGDAPRSGKVRDITGPGITDSYGINATDLGISVRMKNGEILTIFGDSFSGRRVGDGEWRSPTGMISKTTDLEAGLKWDRAAGPDHDQARQLLPYVHGQGFSTVLPSDVICLPDGTLVMHVMVNQGLGNVLWTELQVSRDNGKSWQHSGIKFGGDWNSGFRQLWTMEYDPDDGFVYAFSTGFQRNKGLILHRIHWEQIVSPGTEGKWEPWGYRDGKWAWGNPATVILPGRFGEMYLRRLDTGYWTLTYFNAEHYRIDCMVFDSPVANMFHARADQKTLLHGGAWGRESDTHVAQLYCGAPIPGSTPDRWHYVVSQWNTSDSVAGKAGWPYKSMQFVNSIPVPINYQPPAPEQPVIDNPDEPSEDVPEQPKDDMPWVEPRPEDKEQGANFMEALLKMILRLFGIK